MKKLFLLLAIAGGTSVAQAQQDWQWARRGGGGAAGGAIENVDAIATDHNGNVYTLSKLNFGGIGVDIAGTSISGVGTQIVMSSFTCNGDLRWAKVVNPGNPGAIYGLKTDAEGGVYVSGGFYNTPSAMPFIFGTDTAVAKLNKKFFLLKCDAAGNLKWFRQPQSDTVATAISNQKDIFWYTDVDAAGNVYELSYLKKGRFGTATSFYDVAAPGMYILQYNKGGDFTGGTKLAIDLDTVVNPNGPNMSWEFARTPAGKYVVTGSVNNGPAAVLTIGGTLITKWAFVASFKTDGSFDWLQQSKNSFSSPGGHGYLQAPTADNQGDVYVTGTTVNGDGFGNVTFSNPIATYTGTKTAMALKLNGTTGNVVWANAAANTVESMTGSATLSTAGEFVISGNWLGTLYWPGHAADSVRTEPGKTQMFLARFSSLTGSLVKMDTLYHSAANGSGSPLQALGVLAADDAGNVFLGSSFGRNLKVGNTTLTGRGTGAYDFFVAKYGTAFCKPSGVEKIINPAGGVSLILAPNPAATEAQISYQLSNSNGSLEVYDLAGRMLFRKVLNGKTGTEKLSLAEYVSGIYLVVLRQAGAVVQQQRLSVVR